MKRLLAPRARNVTLLVLLLLSLLASACSDVADPIGDLSGRKIRITTTVGMIADVIANIGGERVEVTSLMGAGVDPHLYKPSARDVEKLDRADIIFYNGLHLEGRMVELFEKIEANGKHTIAVARDIDPAKLRKPIEFEGNYDPHIWFDVTLWEDAARTIAEVLQEIDPTSAALYASNANAYLAKLDALDTYAQEQINTIPVDSRVLVTAHDAFGYFGARYGVEVMGLQGTSTATEAGAGDVQALSELIAERKIKAIFIESSVPPATIEAVQAAVRSRGWDVKIGGELFADAMGAAGTEEGTYIGMVRHNVDTIVAALK